MDRLTVSRVEEILSKARDLRVLVVGDVMLDRYIMGTVGRISPEAPVPVVRVEEESLAVGGAGNVAANVIALGASCRLIASVGDDPNGRLLVEALAGQGVEVDGVLASSRRPTTVKTRIQARSQQIVRVDRETDDEVDEEMGERLVEAVAGAVAGCQAVALEDYNKGLFVSRVIAAALGRDGVHDLPTVVDPKRLRFFEFSGCTVFKPNEKELEDAFGERLQPDDPGWLGRARARLKCEHLLLTLGERGLALATADDTYLRVPAVARSVYDVSGAGDTVTAITAVCLAVGADPTEAAVLANHAAALEVSKAGVATVSATELLDHYSEFVSA